MRRLVRGIAVVLWSLAVSGGAAWATPAPAPPVLQGVRASAIDGNLRAAIEALEPYVATHPKDPEAARMLGDLYFRNADPNRAEAVWLAATRRMPDDLETHERLGNLYASRNRLGDAIREYEQSLPLRWGLFRLIELERRTNGIATFQTIAHDEARENPDDPWRLTFYATVLEATEHASEALQYYTRVVELSPLGSKCDALENRAVDLLDLKREAEAISDLRGCLHNDPDEYGALTMLGFIYVHDNIFDLARPLLEHAVAMQPYGVEGLIDLGYLYDATGDNAGAAQLYRRALAGDPLRPEAYINLGFDYAARRDYARAEAMYTAGLSAVPGNGRLHFLLGVAYRNQGKIAEAAAEFESALKADDADVSTAARDALATLPNGIQSYRLDSEVAMHELGLGL